MGGCRRDPRAAPAQGRAAFRAGRRRRSDAVAVARATITEGWSWRERAPVPLEVPVAWDELCLKDRAWACRLQALAPIVEPLRAYGETRDASYLEWSVAIALDWARQHPRFIAAAQHVHQQFAWYDMTAGQRAAPSPTSSTWRHRRGCSSARTQSFSWRACVCTSMLSPGTVSSSRIPTMGSSSPVDSLRPAGGFPMCPRRAPPPSRARSG